MHIHGKAVKKKVNVKPVPFNEALRACYRLGIREARARGNSCPFSELQRNHAWKHLRFTGNLMEYKFVRQCLQRPVAVHGGACRL